MSKYRGLVGGGAMRGCWRGRSVGRWITEWDGVLATLIPTRSDQVRLSGELGALVLQISFNRVRNQGKRRRMILNDEDSDVWFCRQLQYKIILCLPLGKGVLPSCSVVFWFVLTTYFLLLFFSRHATPVLLVKQRISQKSVSVIFASSRLLKLSWNRQFSLWASFKSP